MIDVCCLQGCDYLRFGGFWISVKNIFFDCLIEEDRLLSYIADLSSEVPDVNVFDVFTIDENAAFFWVIEALNELDYCAFA